ncbi:MAG TPA: hypothetical protein VLD63_07790 [Anaerolineales bacterium]|nr:hypothetical protein [Anaerolineales bacterium]
MSTWNLILAGLFTLPVLGAGVLLAVRRAPSLRHLAPAILLSAVTTSILAAGYGFSQSTMPIRPYEGEVPWLDLAKTLLGFVYVGFGVGAVLASALVVPTAMAARLLKRRGTPTDQVPSDPVRHK